MTRDQFIARLRDKLTSLKLIRLAGKQGHEKKIIDALGIPGLKHAHAQRTDAVYENMAIEIKKGVTGTWFDLHKLHRIPSDEYIMYVGINESSVPDFVAFCSMVDFRDMAIEKSDQMRTKTSGWSSEALDLVSNLKKVAGKVQTKAPIKLRDLFILCKDDPRVLVFKEF